jgi:drug/metabolite transporter (DMT)-like permease
MKGPYVANLFLLHAIVLVWGLTGILGNEISLSAVPLVWWRVVIAVLTILLFVLIRKIRVIASAREMARFAAVGLLTAAHWVFFFAAIKYSKISVALVVLSTSAFFVSILGPLVRRERIQWYEMGLGLIVIAGLSLIFNFESQYVLGIVLALVAAFLASLFSTLNSRLVIRHSPVQIAFWEMLFAAIGLTVFLLFSGEWRIVAQGLNTKDLAMLLVLGILCTGVAFIVSIRVMRVLTPFTCALAINLEPVYTILIALWLYGESEYMSVPFYAGAAVILSTLFIDAALKRRSMKKANG